MRSTVNYNQLNLFSSDFKRYESALSILAETLARDSVAKDILKAIQSECNVIRQIGTALESIVTEYSAAEAHLCSTVSANVTQTSIASYVKENDVAHMLSTFNFSVHFIDDVGFFTGFSYFFSHFDDNMKAVINSCGGTKDFFRQLMKGTLSNAIAEEFMNDKENAKKLLSGVIEGMFDNKAESKYEGTELKTLKALDALTDDSLSEELRQILDGSYATNKGLSKISKATEKIGRLLADYTDNIELLESVKSIAPNNHALSEVIDDILFDYQHKFTALLQNEVLDKVEEFVAKSVDSILGTNLGLVNTVIKGTIGQVPAMDSLDTVIHITNIKSGAIEAYRTAAATVSSGAYTDADFNAYINSFNLCKELTLKEYRSMLKYYNNPYSKEHLYLDSQITILEHMTYDNVTTSAPFAQFKATSDGSGYGGLFSGGNSSAGGGGGGRVF